MMVSQEEQGILHATEDYVRREMQHDNTDHGWPHVQRVDGNAILLQREESGDLFVIRMGALLHDIGDPKLHNQDTTAANRIVGSWLERAKIERKKAEHILYIVNNSSFYKSLVNPNLEKSLEFRIVQDADWLEAIGAMGIARALHYGGAKGREIYNPSTSNKPLTAERYINDGGSKDSISHLHEKGLILPSMLNTKTARKIGEARDKILREYLTQFHKEWNREDFNV